MSDFFVASKAISDPNDKGVSEDFQYSGGNPSAVRGWFIATCNSQPNLQDIHANVLAAVGYVLSVLLFGAARKREVAHKKTANFSDKTRECLQRPHCTSTC